MELDPKKSDRAANRSRSFWIVAGISLIVVIAGSAQRPDWLSHLPNLTKPVDPAREMRLEGCDNGFKQVTKQVLVRAGVPLTLEGGVVSNEGPDLSHRVLITSDPLRVRGDIVTAPGTGSLRTRSMLLRLNALAPDMHGDIAVILSLQECRKFNPGIGDLFNK